MTKLTLEGRIRERILPPDEHGCRRWQGMHVKGGYGTYHVRRNGRTTVIMVHRFIYEAEVGPIPDGYTIDHVKARGCRWNDCSEPSHLEPVTLRENILRGDGPAAQNARKTHCPQGHPYDEENTEIRRSGARRCRTCSRAAGREAQRRKRAQQPRKPRTYPTHCPQGHEFTPENTYRFPSQHGRLCKTCWLEKARARQVAAKAAK